MTSPRPKSLFDALKHLVPEARASGEPLKPDAPDPFAGKVVVSISRKGRGGRTVTIVSGLRGDASGLEALCRELKKALGCGASVDGLTLVVSGDGVDRVRNWLEGKGAKRVVVGT